MDEAPLSPAPPASPSTTAARRPQRRANSARQPTRRCRLEGQAAPSRRFAWAPVARSSGYHVELYRGSSAFLLRTTTRAQIVIPAAWESGGRVAVSAGRLPLVRLVDRRREACPERDRSGEAGRAVALVARLGSAHRLGGFTSTGEITAWLCGSDLDEVAIPPDRGSRLPAGSSEDRGAVFAAAKRTALAAVSIALLVAVVVGGGAAVPRSPTRSHRRHQQNVHVERATSSTVLLGWDVSVDGVGLDGYFVYEGPAPYRTHDRVAVREYETEYLLSDLPCGESADVAISAVRRSRERVAQGPADGFDGRVYRSDSAVYSCRVPPAGDDTDRSRARLGSGD